MATPLNLPVLARGIAHVAKFLNTVLAWGKDRGHVRRRQWKCRVNGTGLSLLG
jgi:hypothetical protein